MPQRIAISQRHHVVPDDPSSPVWRCTYGRSFVADWQVFQHHAHDDMTPEDEDRLSPTEG